MDFVTNAGPDYMQRVRMVIGKLGKRSLAHARRRKFALKSSLPKAVRINMLGTNMAKLSQKKHLLRRGPGHHHIFPSETWTGK